MVINVANRLAELAKSQPDTIAVAEPLKQYINGVRQYKTITYRQMYEYSGQISSGLRQMGVTPGKRIALLVRPGIDFFASVFGLLRSGAVMILIDPGMGGKNLIRCLVDSNPDGFFAIPAVHAVRCWLQLKSFGRAFPNAKLNITAGRRWFWGGETLEHFKRLPVAPVPIEPTDAHDPAAIIFTTGSTGPSKGVLYEHGTFETQVSEIARQYDIHPGQIDLPGFPMFGLFNCAMGSTVVIPDMDASHPAQIDPKKVLEAIRQWHVTQSFGSPAIWNRVCQYCKDNHESLDGIKMILTAGAPLQEKVLQLFQDTLPKETRVFTPYGATEALPVASIERSELVNQTIAQSRTGAGICVGRHFPSIEWKVIKITDEPITSLTDIQPMETGQIGELIVTGPQISPQYVTRLDANATGKIPEYGPQFDKGQRIWHRMGDVGHLDNEDRFWFCGRMAHRVQTARGPLYSIPTEAIFLNHPKVFRAALVGVHEGTSAEGSSEKSPEITPSTVRKPVIIIEPRDPNPCRSQQQCNQLLDEIRDLAKSSPITESIETFLIKDHFPVDIRHNAKIFREKLTVWAQEQL